MTSAADTPSIEPNRALLDLAPVAMFVDRAGEIVYANPAGARLLGVDDPGSLVGAPVRRFVVDDDTDVVRARIRQVEERGHPTPLEDVRLVRADGGERVGAIRSMPVRYGGKLASLSIVLDVTRERRARRDLEASERSFRSLFEESREAVYRTTRDGRIVQANRAMQRLFGYSEEEMLGLSADQLYAHAAGRRRFRAAMESSGFVQDFEIRARHSDGSEMVCLVTASSWGEDGDERSGYQGIVRDVTEPRRLRAKLREREERYRELVEAVDVVPWELRVSDWTFTYVAPQAERIFGYDRERWYEPGFWPDHIHPQDREEAVRFCRAQTRQLRDHQFEYRFLHADGHPVWVRDIVSVVEDPERPKLLRGVMLDITERKRFERQLEEQALRDALTGLPNRTLFWDRLEHALARARREESAVAVLFIDLDRFKRINDSLGHAAGDVVLKEVARRLESAFRHEDTVARFGGDEFAVIVEDVREDAEAEDAAARFLRDLREPCAVEGEAVHLAASVGIALGRPGVDDWLDGGGADELVRRADEAMFRAKDRPGHAARVLRPDEDVGGDERLHRERELREGIERGEFRVFYQSLVRLEDDWIVGAEALARWEHPEEGLVSPARFVPLAEESGLIVPLGRQLFEEACETMSGWLDAGVAGRPLRLSVNLSARQFDDPELPSMVRRVLEATGLEPSMLCFEVTERLVMRGYDRVKELRALGVAIAVDDFGTGYSSLHYLKRLDVDALKIDRAFVSGLGDDYRDEAIVRTVVTLGDTLDLEVVAEGIERREQKEALRRLGCRKGQGFHFDRPMPPSAFSRRLRGEAPQG